MVLPQPAEFVEKLLFAGLQTHFYIITYLTDGPARIEIGSDYLIVGALNRIMATQ